MDILEKKFRNVKAGEKLKLDRKKQAYIKKFGQPEESDERTKIKRQILWKYDDKTRSYKKNTDISSKDMMKKMKDIKIRLKKWKKMMGRKKKQSN